MAEQRFENLSGEVLARLPQLSERVGRWREHLAPLLRDDGALDSDDIRASLVLLETLRSGGRELLPELRGQASELCAEVEQALFTLDELEADLKARLSRLDPEAQDRKRLRRSTSFEPLEQTLSAPRPAEAAGLGAFAALWNGFTLLHMSAMIGGLWKAIGPAALFLLFFYAIFFGAGFTLVRDCFRALGSEKIRMSAGELLITRKMGPIEQTRRIALGESSRFTLVRSALQPKGRHRRELSLRDAHGREHRFGKDFPEEGKDALLKSLNRQLELWRAAA